MDAWMTRRLGTYFSIRSHGRVLDRHLLFLVEKGMEGFSLGQRIKDKLGMRASGTAELVFEDVKLPAENLVGELDGAVSCMMRNLEIERVGLGAMSVGIARRCIDVMIGYSNERKAFGEPLNRFGQIQRHVGESYAKYMAGKCYTYNVATNLDLNATGNRLRDGRRQTVLLDHGKKGRGLCDPNARRIWIRW